MLTRSRIAGGLVLVLGALALAGFAVSPGLGTHVGQTDNSDNTFTSAPSFVNTGYLNPSAHAADTGGDDNGFELNPTYAYGDGPLYATNADGPGDRHRYYNYGISVPGGSTIDGIRVRLDWWLDGADGDNSLGVELSWDGGRLLDGAEDSTPPRPPASTRSSLGAPPIPGEGSGPSAS